METAGTYISVILPLRLEWNPCYFVPGSEGPVSRGDRVSVSFAGRRYVGVVRETGIVPDIDKSRVMNVLGVLGNLSPVSDNELRLWDFVADYYLCSEGEVYKAAYPAVKIDGEIVSMRTKERARAAIEKKIAALKARLEHTETILARRRELLEKAVKQTVKDRYSEDVRKYEAEALRIGEELRWLVVPDAGEVPEGIREYCRPALSMAQKEALERILTGFSIKKPVLLDGVTGSGKTEIYISLALDSLSRGKSVLYLIPEIAVSRQLEERLRSAFGNRLLPFHSRETAARRNSVMESVREGGYVVLGTRSAVFLPYRDLGLVIVDEEHDPSYKQDAPAPRYNGRDTALMLARIHGADVLLGTATPSLESLYNCRTGRFHRVILSEKYFGASDTEIEIIDTAAERRKKGMKGSFSFRLISRVNDSLSSGGQVLLLRARRSYAPSLQCVRCGDIPHCPHCNVPLSWHRQEGLMMCHYCGSKFSYTGICTRCGATLEPLGAGTQKVEEEARELFPGARIARLDSDTSASAIAEKNLVKDFSEGKIDILVGTQIVTKGFDFGGLSLVAVIQADSLLGQQDFRADERAVQLLGQFMGRGGRRGQKCVFVIQTSRPEHPVYRVFSGDFRSEDLAEAMLSERYAFGYPPFSRIIRIIVKDRDEALVDSLASSLAEIIRKEFRAPASILAGQGPVSVLGPYPPPVDKASDLYIRHIRVSVMKGPELAERKRMLDSLVGEFSRTHSCTGGIVLDVDP
ncbi:MAG: primosomal protein N' [Candidatus Cryptobacteroides sp.]